MFSRGPTVEGTLRTSRKTYAREVIQVVEKALMCAKTELSMAFDNSNLEGVKVSP